MKVFLSGFGTVGQGVFEILLLKEKYLKDNYDASISVVGVVDSSSFNIDKKSLCGFCVLATKTNSGKCGPNARDGKPVTEIMDMTDYDVLIETSPTDIENGGEGLANIRHALASGKDVVTVNKGPLALEYPALAKLAEENGCILKYEGSVGGAMPIISLCHTALAGQRIKSIRGILNGTCNYILSRMDTGLPFSQALREAQQLGYAEADPTYDIEGIDAASKVAILANSIFDRAVTIRDVSVTGITAITPEAVAMAAERGMVIRLIGEVSDDRLEVAPRLVPKGHALAISGTLNTAQVLTDLAGPITVSGRGAGKHETASAILSDLISIMESRK
ncbi:MAG: homoserine dehydrogenase [Thermoplasmatales archaeon]|nr:homoserine dehydrogenase [Thermoplasmatales archaeon]